VLVSIIAFLVFVAVFTLLFRATTRTIGQRVGEWVDRRHRAAEQILETGRPPQAWLEGLPPSSPERARRRLLRELRRLQKYFERSPLVDTEETRHVLVGQLKEVGDKWKAAPAAEVLTPAEREAL
jgi:hypothetical protein